MDAGLQVKELARAAGVNEMTIINWEKDRTKPMPENLINLKQILVMCECID